MEAVEMGRLAKEVRLGIAARRIAGAVVREIIVVLVVSPLLGVVDS
jgi:hypothetical protein